MMGVIAALILIGGYVLYVWWRNRISGAPYVPMDAGVVERVLKIAEVGEGDVFYDLGSGDGRLAIGAAMKGANSYGIELDKLRVVYSRAWIWVLRLSKKAEVIHGDIFNTDFSSATVVCTYLLQETNDKLQEKLKREVKPGTKVVSVAFKYKDWKPIKVDPRGTIYGPIYLYKI